MLSTVLPITCTPCDMRCPSVLESVHYPILRLCSRVQNKTGHWTQNNYCCRAPNIQHKSRPTNWIWASPLVISLEQWGVERRGWCQPNEELFGKYKIKCVFVSFWPTKAVPRASAWFHWSISSYPLMTQRRLKFKFLGIQKHACFTQI